jgi:phosphoribosylaminoimidazolecarboxamide formyltransferase/IMP cyclohydrolase
VKRRALISVSDKSGIVEFGRGLVELGWTLLSTGGTARTLREGGLDVTDVSEVTGHPEMMDGRVKTLHPAIHAGLLARRDMPGDTAALAAQGYSTIDLVCVNLYPFHEAAARGAGIAEAMEQVDIGGPSMLRSAAKNHASVIVVADPLDYDRVLAALRAGGAHEALRRELARKVFAHTALYDSAIAAYLEDDAQAASGLPDALVLGLRRVQSLRYGENPDQSASFYREPAPPTGSLPQMRQLHGRELSFNNLLDVEAVAMGVSAWHGEDTAACVIVKHTTPCGIALGDSAVEAYERALRCDPVSAFGGIVGFNCAVDEASAGRLRELFLEIIVAPAFDPDALAILTQRKNLRLITLPLSRPTPAELDFKRVRGGFVVQSRMSMEFPEDAWRVVTKRAPTDAERADLRFAWRAAASVKSNAIVLASANATIGIGAGQMSRVDASRIAVMKANDQNLPLAGAALASDAFFPFRDSVDAAAASGIAAVIQPGGSVRDDEVIAAADQHDIAMVFTGRRLFRH